MKNIMKKFSNSFFRASVIVALFAMSLILIPSSSSLNVYASPQDELKAIESQLNQTNQSIEAKKQEADSLASDVALFDEQIQQTQLKIQTTTQKIAILKEQIAQTEVDLKTQQETLNEYLRVIYEESNTSQLELIARANSFSDFVDRTEYLQTMQIKIKDTVDRVKQMKADLEANKKETEKMKDQLDSQKTELNGKRAGKETLLAVTQGQQANYESEANGLLAKKGALYCKIYGGCGGDINGDLIVKNDPSFPYFNQANYKSNLLNIPAYGCLITSYAMVRSHITGTTITPDVEATYPNYSFSGSYMTSSGNKIAGYPEKIVTGNWKAISAALDIGHPVIVGLNMDSDQYPTHFVVLIGHSGSTYYVNDPAFTGITYKSSRVFNAFTY